jgi:hypothetical protein
MATGSVTSGDVRLLVLRGAVGVVMVVHGYNHILGRWKDCGYQPLRHNCVCRPARRADVDPVLRFEGASHPAARRGYVRDVERQLALRLNRSNEATSCWSWADSVPVPDAVVPGDPGVWVLPHRQQKSRDLGKRQSSAMAAPRAARRSLQALQGRWTRSDKAPTMPALRGLWGAADNLYRMSGQVRLSSRLGLERRHRERASDWCEVARSACLSRSQGSLAALLDLAALSLDDTTPYLAPPQLALRDLQLLDGAMATEFCGLRTHLPRHHLAGGGPS